MEEKMGRHIIAISLCVLFLSVLAFIFLEGMIGSMAQTAENGGGVALVESADPWAFTGAMDGYSYDLYRVENGKPEYVPPPELEYTDASRSDSLTLGELAAATNEIEPASREVKINLLTLVKTPTAKSTPVVNPSILAGDGLTIAYTIEPATKTVILEGGTGTAEVQVLPSAVDLYIAVTVPSGRRYFLNRYSAVTKRFYGKPVKFISNEPINRLNNNVGGFRLTSNNTPGHYAIKAVMTPPKANVFDKRNWISNLATAPFKFGILAE